MADLLVKAPQGQKCPREDNHRKYITDDEKGTTVPDTVFYRRLIAEGSLDVVKPSVESTKSRPAKEVPVE